MNSLKFVWPLAICALLSFSCKKKCNKEKVFSFSDNTTAYTASEQSAEYGPGENDFWIYGTAGSKSVSIRIPYNQSYNDGVTSFTLSAEGSGSSTTAWASYNDGTKTYTTDQTHSGTITLSNFGKKELCLEGTFSFTGANGNQTIDIKNGKFTIGYTLSK